MSRRTIFLPAFLRLILLATLAACAAPTDLAPTPTVPPTAAPTSTRAASPTAIVSPEQTSTIVSKPSTPPASAWQISDDILFDNRLHPECRLPCWQDLRINESDTDDIQHMFDTVFGFGGTQDFFPANFEATTAGRFYGAGNQWSLKDDPLYPEFLAAYALVEETSGRYKQMDFYWAAPRFDPYLTPQRVMQELGQPSSFMVYVTLTEAVGTAVVKLLIIYDEGMAFQYAIWAPVTRAENDAGQDFRLEFCLGGESWLDREAYAGFGRTAHIMEPLINGTEDLTDPQQNAIGIELDAFDYSPVEEVFDVTLDDLYAVALQSGPSCLYLDR